jgi:hypothetical protein
MIYKFQPFSVTKELGKEYNAHCALVPNEDDWILILDYDCMILSTDAYRIMENAIKAYPDTGIFGAMTNRVGYTRQRHGGEISENDSISHHMNLAKNYSVTYPDGHCRDVLQVAGMFMLFRKSTWLKCPFPDQIVDSKGKNFDFHFCNAVRKLRLPLRIIKGVYVWHTYRLGKNYYDKSHLHGSH